MLMDSLGDYGSFGLLIVVLICLLAVGIKIPFALLATSFIGFGLILPERQWGAVGSVVWGSMEKPLLAAIPLFVFMGELFQRSRTSRMTYDALAPISSWIPGGLLHSNIAACSVFAAASGSSVGTAAAMGSVALPQLHERKYPRAISFGSLAAGGTLGILIPPSLGFILYGSITGTSIGDLFIAGIIPGITLAACFSLYIAVWAVRHHDQMPTREKASIGTALRALFGILPLIAVVAFVLGSIYLGLATPSESAALGAGGMLLLVLAFGPRDRRTVLDALGATVRVSVMILLIILGGSLLSYIVGYLRVAQSLANTMTDASVNVYVILIAIFVMYLILGMFLESTSVLVLTLPIVFPIAMAVDINPVWLGVFVVVNLELGLLTPPVGLNLFIIQAIDKTAQFGQIVRGAMPFAAVMVVFLVILVLVPEMPLWLID